MATAEGHTGHFPVRLAGARADEPALHDLRPAEGADEVPEMAPDSATLPFARLVRRLAGALCSADPPAAARAADLPTFPDGVALLAVADAVDGGQPSMPTATWSARAPDAHAAARRTISRCSGTA